MHKELNSESPSTPEASERPENSAKSSRRRFLRTSAGTGILGAMASMAPGTVRAQDHLGDDLDSASSMIEDFFSSLIGGEPEEEPILGEDPDDEIPDSLSNARRVSNHERRVELSHAYLDDPSLEPAQAKNEDEAAYAEQRYYASFTKTLPSNDYCEVEPEAFVALVSAMNGDENADFSSLTLDAAAVRRLANPQGALKYQSCGLDGHASRIDPSHRMGSAQLAGEMVEVYWQALTRDIPFEQFGDNGQIAAAIQDLNNLSVSPGGARNGPASAQNLFRGETPGDLQGPYISQFLWKDFSFGPMHLQQRYPVPRSGEDFMTGVDDWRAIQKGATPTIAVNLENQPLYIYNGRTLGEYVHRDVSFQAYLNAALVLLGYGSDALSPGSPYSSTTETQGAFVSHGAPFILDLVSRAAQAALHAAWYQKWSVHRFLRPEALGGRVHFRVTENRNYEIHSDLLNSQVLNHVWSRQGTYLLSQAYPEGSPTHPSYPAGHACIAGACVTILKALFNENYVIPDPVVAANNGRRLNSYGGGDLSVGGELNKLANNISLGRDVAGVHYRQDGIQGLLAGEQVAISLLREASSSCHEVDFNGYQFVDFLGQPVQVGEPGSLD